MVAANNYRISQTARSVFLCTIWKMSGQFQCRWSVCTNWLSPTWLLKMKLLQRKLAWLPRQGIRLNFVLPCFLCLCPLQWRTMWLTLDQLVYLLRDCGIRIGDIDTNVMAQKSEREKEWQKARELCISIAWLDGNPFGEICEQHQCGILRLKWSSFVHVLLYLLMIKENI